MKNAGLREMRKLALSAAAMSAPAAVTAKSHVFLEKKGHSLELDLRVVGGGVEGGFESSTTNIKIVLNNFESEQPWSPSRRDQLRNYR